MDSPEETLQEEVHHDAVVRTETTIAAIVLAVILLAAAAWYFTTHGPATPAPGTPVATSTPSGGEAQAAVGHLDEVSTYYEVKAAYPSATPLAASAGAMADENAVAVMKQYEQNSIDAFKEQGNFAHLSHDDVQMMGLDQRKETLEITYKMYTGPHTISYVYTMYQDTLGAHPNAYYRTFTFLTTSGQGLDISDVFVPSAKYLDTLSAAARKALPALVAAREGVKVADVDTAYIKRGTTPDADNFQNWYIDGTNLVLIFAPYQVAAYAAGELTVSLPLSSLTSLNSRFK